MHKPALLKKGDIIIIISALLLVCLIWLAVSAWRNGNSAHGLIAEIYLDGQLTDIISLTNDVWELRLDSVNGYNVLQIGPQSVRMLEADCLNQDCVHTGVQSQPGSLIACLPHRLLVCVKGGKEAAFDAITR